MLFSKLNCFMNIFYAYIQKSLKALDLELTLSSIMKLQSEEAEDMTIKEVANKFNISADTLRYYERVGIIPEVHRTAGGIRNYSDDDIKWVETAVCFRSAGMPIELLIEYVRLFKEGDNTVEARCSLLKEARERILTERRKYDDALAKMNYKIKKYEEAVRTGVLKWDDEPNCHSSEFKDLNE